MCCCETPTINGIDRTYRWQPNDAPGIHPVNPPALDGCSLLIDAPGRCGGLDSHSHHYRLVQRGAGMVALLVRHGGGDERVNYISRMVVKSLAHMDQTAAYWLMNAIFSAYHDGKREGSQTTERKWREAASEKRIKVRRSTKYQSTTVTIAPRPMV